MGLSPEDEEIASQYRKMLGMGLPEGAVIQKMNIGAVPQHIQDAVLGGEDNSSAVDDSVSDAPTSNAASVTDGASQSENRTDPHNRSSASFWEEEVVEDDESIEEEVVEDDEEFEEEVLEEEVVDDSDDDNENEDQKEDSESDSDGPESTGAAPETEEIPETGETTATDVYESATPGGDVDIENQQEVQADRAQPSMIPMGSPPEKLLPSPSYCWYWMLCLALLLLIGAGAGGGYWLTTMSGDDVSILKSQPRTNPPTAAPSVSVSSEFDAPQGDCKFDGVANPNPIDQCLCFGKITDVETDIEDRYFYNVEHFIPNYFEDYDEDLSSCSPRNQALVWMSSGNDAKLSTSKRVQKFALATVFASLGGSKWNNSTNWLSGDDFCSWYGVTCEEDDVTELVLGTNNLVGMLPSELSLLESLQFLTVTGNKVSGPLPVSLFSLPELGTIDVSFNSITGVIPPAVGNAPLLNSLNVGFNSMSGRLTRSIGKASNLLFLNLRDNKFVSELPVELFDLQNLDYLDIGGNEFSGTIPDKLSALSALEALRLGPNLFTGSIPVAISSLDKLKNLHISGMEGISGRIPAEFGFELNSLEQITISETSVSGNIDTSFGRLPSLKKLDFSKNQLRSVIPSELGNLENLENLDLGYNFLDGQIPETLGNILTLRQIRLNDNLLQGGIPISFGSLSSLEYMRLEANRLEDRVADEICNLREDALNIFVVDCPVEIRSDSGTETFGVVCDIPECCSECVNQ